MRVASKVFNLMGNKYKYGGVALDSNNILYVVVNEANKLVAINLVDSYIGPDAIKFSTNAFGYAPYCEVESITVLDSPLYNFSILMLLKNGEIWRKDLSTKEEEKWADPAWSWPHAQCRGASAIEYYDGSLYAAFPQFNVVRKLAIPTLQVLAEYPLGVTSDSPYPPTALSYDGVNDRWITIDPVKGDLVYGNRFSFQEAGRERYTYGIYNRCFDGDLAWSKSSLPDLPGHDFFVICVENMVMLFREPWYKMYQVDDFTGVYTEIDGVLFDNAEIHENMTKHLRIENVTDRLRQGMTISLTDNPMVTADDYLHVSLTPAGPWEKSISVGDVNGYGVVDFYIRFFPQATVELGTFMVELVVDWQNT